MIPPKAFLLACLDADEDPGLWFVFYGDVEGLAAFDVTREHTGIAYKGFEAVLDFQDIKPETEKIVLQGGPERADDALIILHETKAATSDSSLLSQDFAMLSYTYILQPGHPPRLAGSDGQPSVIRLKTPSRFLISMGYRIFDTEAIKAQLKARQWIALPATPDIIFDTPRRGRRARFLNRMN